MVHFFFFLKKKKELEEEKLMEYLLKSGVPSNKSLIVFPYWKKESNAKNLHMYSLKLGIFGYLQIF